MKTIRKDWPRVRQQVKAGKYAYYVGDRTRDRNGRMVGSGDQRLRELGRLERGE